MAFHLFYVGNHFLLRNTSMSKQQQNRITHGTKHKQTIAHCRTFHNYLAIMPVPKQQQSTKNDTSTSTGTYTT
jgi:hypothetical protein